MRTPISVEWTRGSPSSLMVIARKTAAMAFEHEAAALASGCRRDAARIHQSGEGRAEAGQREGDQPQALQADAGEPRRLAVAADGIETPAERRLLEEDPDEDDDRHATMVR